MPTTRKHVARRMVPRVDGPHAFHWCADGYSTSIFGPVYANEADARAAWEIHRRAVWSESPRMDIPHTARLYDGLTTEGMERLRFTFGFVAGVDLAGTLAALARDRQAVTNFEMNNPQGAYAIADYLQMWRADLGRIEKLTHELHVDRYGGAYKQLSTSQTYGEQS